MACPCSSERTGRTFGAAGRIAGQASARAVHRFTETSNRSISLFLRKFRTENRYTPFLELL
ncbi:MAG: hypothetical protein E5V89_06465 [Mesorhizobium sp.]|nr:MAG: hypothetical protein E5V89_06465 [Mesorhizobium sp.]